MMDVDWQFEKVSLTERERDILRLLTNGLTDSEVAETLFLTVGTVKWYNRQIYSKLAVRNRTEAITRAQRLGLLTSAPQPTVLTASAAPIHKLPAQITSFIGRSRELADLKASLLASRLVTLTGPPGTGKTRLALEVASALLPHYRDGVYFVSLASIQDANLVAHTIAPVLGVNESGSESILAALKATLRDKHVLLVLDNFEHLLTAAPLVSELLAAAPRLTVLVTSREILRLYGEQDFPVPPLQLPDLKQKVEAEALQSYEAIELFIQRAHAAQSTFALSDQNAASVATICIQLDGLPLAIELAAARIKFYAPQMLLVRLSNRLETLGEGARDLPARQRTLRATLAWSYDLLTPEEQTLFARLGVFAGGFSLADAEAVCGDGLGTDVGADLESLLNKSLLRQIQSVMDEPCFMMLETMREYALEKLVESGEIERLRERHALYFLSLAEQAEQGWSGPLEGEWFVQMESQQDNLHTALRWSLTHDDSGQTSLRFVASLGYFWWMRSYLSEGRVWLTDALRLEGGRTPTKTRARALHNAGGITYMQCDYPAAHAFYAEALDIYRQLGDQGGVAHSLLGLGDVETEIGNYDTAEPMFKQAIQITQELGDQSGSGRGLNLLAWCVLRGRGDFAQATACLEQGLALYEHTNDTFGVSLALSGLGEIAVRQGDFEKAAPLLERSLALRRELGHKWGIAVTLGSMAWSAQHAGDFGRATALLSESLFIRKDIGDPGGIAWCLERLAEMAHARKDDGRAARIFGAAAILRTSVHSSIDPTDQPEHELIIAAIRTRLGDEVYEAVWAEGQAMPLDHLIEYLALTPA